MRNKVLDLLRGHYLLAILIDHFHKFPSPFEYYNGKGDLWVSAATGFVFVSGLLLGIVNFPKIRSKGMPFVTKKLLLRGLKLHLVGVFLTVTYSMVGLYSGSWPYLGQGIIYTTFWEILWNALIFNYSYGWADLLIFYSILIFISPLVMFAINKGFWKAVFTLSFMLWLYALVIPGLQRFSGSYFPVISWQFLFFIGMTVGFHRAKFSALYRKYFSSSLIYSKLVVITLFASSLLTSVLDIRYKYFSGAVKETMDLLFNKLELGPGRLLVFFVWFVFFYWVFHRFYIPIYKYLGWLYKTFGTNSLLTYAIQSALLFGSYYISVGGTYLLNTLWTIVVILLCWGFVKLLRTSWFSWLKI